MGEVWGIMGENRDAYTILVGKLERKGPLSRRQPKWQDNIEMDMKQRIWIGLMSIRIGYNDELL
jgi:hypothetical protein